MRTIYLKEGGCCLCPGHQGSQYRPSGVPQEDPAVCFQTPCPIASTASDFDGATTIAHSEAKDLARARFAFTAVKGSP